MGQISQSNRWLKVQTPLGADQVLLTKLTGREAISELFHFELELNADKEAKIAFDQVVGKKVTVELSPGQSPTRYIHGVIRRLRQVRRDAEFLYLRAELVPAVWPMTLTNQSRVFQQKTVPDILKTVFAGQNVSYAQLKEKYPAHNYCVQYDESDFAFAARLMEEEGIHYYFVHTSSDCQMVLSDKSSANPRLKSQDSIAFDESTGGRRDATRIYHWEKEQELRFGKYSSWDHSFQAPDQNLAATSTMAASIRVGAVDHKLDGANSQIEYQDYPGGYAHRFDAISPSGADLGASTLAQAIASDASRVAKIRMEEQAARAVRIDGESNCGHVTAGSIFALTSHFNGDGDYLITALEHSALLEGYRSGGEQGSEYRNQLTAIPAALPFRPSRTTPTPRIHGLQKAVVVGRSGEEIQTDKYGRVRVQFHWDRFGKGDGSNTCWVRVATAWAGQSWGMITLPRIGQEVLVAFMEGDPDAPLIVGSGFNEGQMPPFALPQSRARSVLKSKSYPNGGSQDFHGLMFDDTKGQEVLRFRSQKDMIIDAKNNHETYAPNTHHVRAGKLQMNFLGGLGGKSPKTSASGSGSSSSSSSSGTSSSSSSQSGGSSSSNAVAKPNSSREQPPLAPAAIYAACNDDGSASESWTLLETQRNLQSSSQPDTGLSWQGVVLEPEFLGVGIFAYYGDYLEVYGGVYNVLGAISYSQTTVDPISFFGTGGTTFNAVVRAATAGVTGYNGFVYGNTLNLNYGPKFDFQRGPAFIDTGHATAAIKLLGGLHATASLAGVITPALIQVNGWSADEIKNTTVIVQGVAAVLQVALVKVEQYSSLAASSALASQDAKRALEQYLDTNIPLAAQRYMEGVATTKADLAKQYADGLDQTAKAYTDQEALTATNNANQFTTNAVQQSTLAAQQHAQNLVNTASQSFHTNVVNGPYHLDADQQCTLETRGNGINTSLLIQSANSAPINVNSNGAAGSITLGTASFGVTLNETNNGIEIGAAAGKTLTLTLGPSALPTAQIVLSDNSIVLQAGTGTTQSKITLTNAQIQLQFGGGTGNQIVVDNNQVQLASTQSQATVTLAAANATTQATNITLNGATKVAVQTAALQVT